jgi:tRNA(fMet)-specific endonuclease VapC
MGPRLHQRDQIARGRSAPSVDAPGATGDELGGVVASGEDADRNRAAMDRFLREVPVAAFDAGAARVYGLVRLASRERRRDALDKLIAVHALALDLTLVTNNAWDFADYPDLRIENWVG